MERESGQEIRRVSLWPLDPFPLPEHLLVLTPHIVVLAKRMEYENGVTGRGKRTSDGLKVR